MGTFNTHGGYFAPKDYFRINEGGSHKENPNGGVQIGHDNNGIPNLLEEGEPVYKDFVYSDNIKADKSILKDFFIPEKYAGKLYSEIADSFIEEAEVRPNDPVSNNGLNVMLGRLADAQEEQKLRKEERALKAELKKLSPEELMLLGSEINQNEQEDTIQQPQIMAAPQPQQIIPEQQIPVEQQSPMMACGGMLKKYADGGYGDFISDYGLSVKEADDYINSLSEDDKAYLLSHGYPKPYEGLGVLGLLSSAGIGRAKGAKAAWKGAKALGNKANKVAASNPISKVKNSLVGKVLASSIDPTYLWRTLPEAKSTVGKIGQTAGKVAQTGFALNNDLSPVSAAIGGSGSPVLDIVGGIRDTNYSYSDNSNSGELVAFPKYTCGGKMNKFEDKGQMYRNGFAYYTAPIKSDTITPIPLRLPVEQPSVEQSPVSNYVPSAISTVTKPVLLKVPKIKDEPIYGLDGVVIDDEPVEVTDTTYIPEEFAEDIQVVKPNDLDLKYPLPTGMRYAGVLNNLIASINNIAQKPDTYRYTPITPSYPTGTMPVQMQEYRPVDMSLPTNAIRAQGNATARAIANSGAGPSTGALLLANGLNTSNALGNAMAQSSIIDAQQKNAVIGANNAAIAQRSAFDAQLASQRAEAQNRANLWNQRNALQIQMMNNAGRQAKAQAVGTTLENLAAGLAGIGSENFRMNQINTNPALLQYLNPNGVARYKSAANGGILKLPDSVNRYDGVSIPSGQMQRSISDKYPVEILEFNSNGSNNSDAVADISTRLRALENSKDNPNGGWDAKKGVWYPHKSKEGGAKTIGYGIKLSNGDKWAKLANEQGYLTDSQVEEALIDMSGRYWESAGKVYDSKYGKGAWAQLSPKEQSILTDYEYNVKGGLKTFPKFMEAIHNRDINKMLAESTRKSGDKPMLLRNAYIANDINSLREYYSVPPLKW